MGRWTDRRAARRARARGDYLSDYYGQPHTPTTGPADPYQVQVPTPSEARQRRRRSRRKRSGLPEWVTQQDRLDPARSGRIAREQRRRAAGWPTSAGRARAGSAVSAPPRDRGRTGRPRAATGRVRAGRPSLGTAGRWRRRAGWAVGFGVAIAVGLGVILASTGAGRPDVSERATVDFDTQWDLDLEQLDLARHGLLFLVPPDTPDRYAGGTERVITAGPMWVVMVEVESHRGLAGIDPADGTVAWQFDLDRAQCSQQLGPQDTLVCLAQDEAGGRDWTGYLIDVATGDELASWPAPITGAWGLTWTEAGLLVLAEAEPRQFTELTLLDVDDGSEVWSVDLTSLDDTDYLFSTRDIDDRQHTVIDQPLWADLGARAALSAGTDLLLIDTGTGEVTVEFCYPTVITDQYLGCSHGTGTLYDTEGEPVWSSDLLDLARPPYRGEHVLVNIAGGQVRHTDWDSGYVGAATTTVERGAIASGTATHPVVIEERELIALSPDGSQVRWEVPVAGMNSITTVWVVDEVAIVAGFSALGLDLATGEELWHRYTAGELMVVDGDLVRVGSRELSLLQVP